MPTTIPGLLLALVLLLPGFTYVVVKERNGVERKPQAFRETLNILVVSMVCDIAVLMVSWYWWSRHLDVDRLLQKPEDYFHDRPGLLAAWGLSLLGAATLLALLAALPSVRKVPPLRWLIGPHLHPSTVSGWWRMFEWYLPKEHTIHVGLFLEDGSYLQGQLASYSNSADDLPDRDLIIVPPIIRRAPGAPEGEKLDVGALAVSARRILALSATYVPPTAASVPPQAATAAEASAESAATAEHRR